MAQDEYVLEKVKRGRVTEEVLATKLTTFIDAMDHDQALVALSVRPSAYLPRRKAVRGAGWRGGQEVVLAARGDQEGGATTAYFHRSCMRVGWSPSKAKLLPGQTSS